MVFSEDPVWICVSRQFTEQRNNTFCFHSFCSYFDLHLEREVYVQLLISMIPCFERLLKGLNTHETNLVQLEFSEQKI